LRQITIRGISDEVEKMVKKEAGKKGLSLNKAFISLLEKAAGTKGKEKKRATFHLELDHLSGIWSKDEADAFKRNLQFQREIDEDLWKNRE